MNVVRRVQKGIVYLHWLNGITTFSFAVLFSSFSLYLTKKMGFSQAESNGVVGFFLAANFILHFVAGYIGDRLISNRLLFAFSTIIQTLGVMLLNYANQYVYLGLSFFLIGCGLGATCINCLITQQFDSDEDQLRERAFFYNYSAMNIGFLAGYIMSGIIDIKDSYEDLFVVSNLVNIITVFFIIKSWKYFEKRSGKTKWDIKKRTFGIMIVILLVPILYIGSYFSVIANSLILLVGAAALFYITFLGYITKNRSEGRAMYSFVFLALASIIFWMLYFVGPMGVAQFLKYNVNIYIGSYYIPPQWIMNLNSIFVIVGSPLVLLFFNKLRKRKIQVSVSMQFVFSLLFIALSFVPLIVGILNSNTEGLTDISWVVAHYLFQALGELLIAPVGYAMIGHLAPEKLQGLMMGTWMMASGISATLSNYFSNLMNRSESVNPFISNEHYMNTFVQLGLYALVGALILWFFSKTVDNSTRLTIRMVEGAA